MVDDLEKLQELYDKADQNKRRSRRALVVATVAAAIAIGLAVGSVVFAIQLRDVPDVQEKQVVTLTRLQEADRQRRCDAEANSKAFGVILGLLADNFATPPAPDVERLAAVQGLRDAAAAFLAAAPVACPT